MQWAGWVHCIQFSSSSALSFHKSMQETFWSHPCYSRGGPSYVQIRQGAEWKQNGFKWWQGLTRLWAGDNANGWDSRSAALALYVSRYWSVHEWALPFELPAGLISTSCWRHPAYINSLLLSVMFTFRYLPFSGCCTYAVVFCAILFLWVQN